MLKLKVFTPLERKLRPVGGVQNIERGWGFKLFTPLEKFSNGASSSFLTGFSVIALVLFLSGCATVKTIVTKRSSSPKIAKSAKFKKTYLETKYFTLLSYYRITKPGEAINIYIEGEANTRQNRKHLIKDPTPKNSLTLKLAKIDQNPNVAYLARPGQYVKGKKLPVDPAYWSDKRFASEVITAMNVAIGQLTRYANTGKINLIGYSDAGAIVVLVAAIRSDVVSLRTIAGNLDIEAASLYHRQSPLSGSLNPIDFAKEVKDLPQRHFVGAKDTAVPPFIAQSFVKRMGDKDYSRVTVVSGATHSKGWCEKWKEFLSYPLARQPRLSEPDLETPE